jgi:hypothetical protein
MQRVDPTTVLVVPWYERGDYEAIREMSGGKCAPFSYEAWLDNAFRDMRELLAKGCALKIVTIHLDDYLAWLENEGERDSRSARSRYIAALALVGSQLDGAPLHTDAPWPGFPTAH